MKALDGEYRHRPTLSLTSALDRGAWVTLRPGSFTSPPGKETRQPLYCTRLGGPQVCSGRARKISPPPGFDPRTVHPYLALRLKKEYSYNSTLNLHGQFYGELCFYIYSNVRNISFSHTHTHTHILQCYYCCHKQQQLFINLLA